MIFSFEQCVHSNYVAHNGAPGVLRNSLICLVTVDLNPRMMVGIDPATGLPNDSYFGVVVGARGTVPLPPSSTITKIPCKWFGIMIYSSNSTLPRMWAVFNHSASTSPNMYVLL